MPEWLSDEELDAIARTFADECDVEKLLAQASEANRLRAGSEDLKYILEYEQKSPGFYNARSDRLLKCIRELLEGGDE